VFVCLFVSSCNGERFATIAEVFNWSHIWGMLTRWLGIRSFGDV
jgi:hypothetical protein